ncbi:MAG: hypothetical protein ACXADW_14000 [Candidatus Hodarchaeales archaeon]|jgi:hypothetical protein
MTYDDFQVTPHSVGDVRGNHTRPPGSKISNYNVLFKGARKSQDYTLTTFEGIEDQHRNPQKGYTDHAWPITDQYIAHDTDWALFEYNPYGHSKDTASFTNPNRRRLTDNWAKVIGVGEVDTPQQDILDTDVISGMVQYRNYPDEGYSSFGKKTGGATGDRRWGWNGNTWVPTS